MSRSLLPSLAFLLSLAMPLTAANRFFIVNQTVCMGQQGIAILLKADTDQTIYGFSFGLNYDESSLTVTQVSLEGTSIPPGAPDFFDGKIDTARGLVGYGCVLDFGPTFTDALPAGENKTIARLVANVIGNPGTTDIRLEPVLTNPNSDRPVKNVMTNDQGSSIVPTLVNGTITITDCKPTITSAQNNQGVAGKVFQVVGLHFGEPGLSVKVCGALAAATLLGDGVTLEVTAPACGSSGFAPLEVCNTYGCDTKTSGFDYEEVGASGVQKPNDENQDGKFDLSDSVSILNHLFLGTNPSLPCGDGTLNAPGNKALLDSNNDGKINLSDAVYDLSFLFVGGPIPFNCAGNPACPCKPVSGCPDNSPKC